MALSDKERKALTMAGFGPAAMASWEKGTADPVLRQRIQMVLSGVNAGKLNPDEVRTGLPAPKAPTQQTPVFGRSVPNPSAGGGVLAANVPSLSAGRPGTTPIRSTIGYGSNPVTGGNSKPFDINQTRGGTQFNSFGGTYGTQEGAAGHPFLPGWVPWQGSGTANTGSTSPLPPMPDNPYGIPNAPDPYAFNIPQVEMHDFTEQAKKIAADAFAPYLAAFDMARTNAQAQGKTSKEATAGLFDNFVKDIAQKAAETGARYDEVKADQAARTTQQQSDIQENANSAQANIGDQLKSYGLEASIPSVLQQNLATETNAQNDAGAAGESQQQFYDTQKLAQGNYDTRFGELQQKAGINAQGDLDSQLMNLLANIDINKANAQGEQGQTALTLAQTLADRDLSMQNSNAGYSLQGQQLQAGQIQNAFENALGLHNTVQGENQQDWKNNFDVWATQLGAGDPSAGQVDISQYPGASRPYAIVLRDTGDPDKADQTTNLIAQEWEAFRNRPEYANLAQDPQGMAIAFANSIAQKGSGRGIPEHTLRESAQEYINYVQS